MINEVLKAFLLAIQNGIQSEFDKRLKLIWKKKLICKSKREEITHFIFIDLSFGFLHIFLHIIQC